MTATASLILAVLLVAAVCSACPSLDETSITLLPGHAVRQTCIWSLRCVDASSVFSVSVAGLLAADERLSFAGGTQGEAHALNGTVDRVLLVSSPMNITYTSTKGPPAQSGGFVLEYSCVDAPAQSDTPSNKSDSSRSLTVTEPDEEEAEIVVFTDAQVALFTRGAYVAVATGVLSGGRIDDVQSLVLLGANPCGTDTIRSGTAPLTWLVQPLQLGDFAASPGLAPLLGFYALVFGELLLHAALVAALGAARRVPLRETMVQCFFPNFSIAAGSALLCGFSYTVFRVMATVSSDPMAVVGLLLSTACLGYIGLLLWAPKRFAMDLLAVQFIRYKHVVRRLPPWVRKFVLPRGYYRPPSLLRTHSALFAFCADEFRWFAVWPNVRVVIFALIAAIGAAEDRCWMLGAVLGGWSFVYALLVMAAQPFRIPASTISTTCGALCLTVVALSYIVPQHMGAPTVYIMIALPHITAAGNIVAAAVWLVEELRLAPRQDAIIEEKRLAREALEEDSYSDEELLRVRRLKRIRERREVDALRVAMLAMDEQCTAVLQVTPLFCVGAYTNVEILPDDEVKKGRRKNWSDSSESESSGDDSTSSGSSLSSAELRERRDMRRSRRRRFFDGLKRFPPPLPVVVRRKHSKKRRESSTVASPEDISRSSSVERGSSATTSTASSSSHL